MTDNNKHLYTLSQNRIKQILTDITKLKVGVIGDACLDIYWHADMTKSELSRETPHHPMPIVKEIYSPGAAGNVAMNLKALGCKQVSLCSVIGKDWRGKLLEEQLDRFEIDLSYLLRVEENWTTQAYCKPIRYGLQNIHQEAPRLDFINYKPLSEPLVGHVIETVDRIASDVDVIAVNDQFSHGIIASSVRERLSFWADKGKIVVADSRDHIGSFNGVVVKPNEVEAFYWYKPNLDVNQVSWETLVDAGKKLSEHLGASCCVTLGEKGALWIDKEKCVHVPANEVAPPLDIVGAGDCFTASLISALATGCSGPEATAFSHLGAAVVIRKLGTTGTATPDEILSMFDEIERSG